MPARTGESEKVFSYRASPSGRYANARAFAGFAEKKVGVAQSVTERDLQMRKRLQASPRRGWGKPQCSERILLKTPSVTTSSRQLPQGGSLKNYLRKPINEVSFAYFLFKEKKGACIFNIFMSVQIIKHPHKPIPEVSFAYFSFQRKVRSKKSTAKKSRNFFLIY